MQHSATYPLQSSYHSKLSVICHFLLGRSNILSHPQSLQTLGYPCKSDQDNLNANLWQLDVDKRKKKYIFWDRTYCDSKGQCVSLWRSHWKNIWCWTTSLWTHSRCRDEQRVQLTRHISKFIWRQNSTSQIEKCHLKRIENFETHEQCACIRQASEGFMKNSVYLIGWNVSSEGKRSKTSANSLLVAPPKPSEAFR